MTLPVQTPVNRYTYAGSAAFTYSFLLLEADDLVVSVNGVPMILGADYTVAGIGNVSGGVVTYLSALTIGDAVALIRDIALERLSDYQDSGDFLAGTFNADFDRLWMATQDVETTFSTRSLRAPLGELILELPPAAVRANNLLGFDSSGQPALAGPASGSLAAYALQLISAFGSQLVGFIQAGIGAVLRTAQDKLRDVAVTPADFGAIGNDSTNDAAAIQNALVAAAGRTLRLEPGKTYLIDDELVMSPGTHIDGNGAQLHFTHTNTGKRCLAVVTGCVVENLFVNNTSGVLGTNGTYQTPVVIGDAASTTVNSNIKLRNLTIASLTPGGNGIAIIGATNVDVEGITYPSSSTIAIPLLCHWSSASGGPSATSHVHNVRIDNIKCGVMSYGTSGALGIAAVFLSAVYGVKVSNIYADQFTHGAAVTVYAGDYGYQYGTTVEQAMGMVGIDITGITGQYLMVGHVYGTNPSGAVQQLWPGGVTFEKLGAYGMGVADANSQGIRLEGCEGVQIKCGAVNAFQVGVYLGGTVTDVTIEDFRILNSRTHGIFGDTTSGTPNFSEIVIRDARIVGSNQSSASNIADINFGACAGLLIEECKFNSPNANWNVVVANTVTVMRVLNNRTLGVGAGPCYAIGANTDTAICSLFEGNTCDAAAIPAGGLRAGQIFIPHAALMRNASGEQPKVFTGSFSPDRGTWARGSLCWNDQASVGQPKGWACTVTGTPGTWVSMGNL